MWDAWGAREQCVCDVCGVCGGCVDGVWTVCGPGGRSVDGAWTVCARCVDGVWPVCETVSHIHLRVHETKQNFVCSLLLEYYK